MSKKDKPNNIPEAAKPRHMQNIYDLQIEYIKCDIHDIKSTLKTMDAKIDSNYKELNTKIDSNYKELNTKIDAIDTKLSAKIDNVDNKLSAKIDNVDNKLSAKIDNNFKWMLGMFVSLLGAFGAGFSLLMNYMWHLSNKFDALTQIVLKLHG